MFLLVCVLTLLSPRYNKISRLPRDVHISPEVKVESLVLLPAKKAEILVLFAAAFIGRLRLVKRPELWDVHLPMHCY
jgi:hypothetical protein